MNSLTTVANGEQGGPSPEIEKIVTGEVMSIMVEASLAWKKLKPYMDMSLDPDIRIDDNPELTQAIGELLALGHDNDPMFDIENLLKSPVIDYLMELAKTETISSDHLAQQVVVDTLINFEDVKYRNMLNELIGERIITVRQREILLDGEIIEPASTVRGKLEGAWFDIGTMFVGDKWICLVNTENDVPLAGIILTVK